MEDVGYSAAVGDTFVESFAVIRRQIIKGRRRGGR